MKTKQSTRVSELVAGMGCKHGDVLRISVPTFMTVHFLVDEVCPKGLWGGDPPPPVLAGHLMHPFDGTRECEEDFAGLALVPRSCQEGEVWDMEYPPELVDAEGYYVPMNLPSEYVEKVGRVTGEGVFQRLAEETYLVMVGKKQIPPEEAYKRMFFKDTEWRPLTHKMWDIVAGK